MLPKDATAAASDALDPSQQGELLEGAAQHFGPDPALPAVDAYDDRRPSRASSEIAACSPSRSSIASVASSAW